MKDNKFMKAIASHDYTAIRDMIRINLLLDHNVTCGSFNECLAECEKAGILQDVFQEHDGRDVPSEKTKSNYNALVGQLATNFSEIRLNKILSIAKELWASEQTAQRSENIASSQKTSDSRERVVGEERVISERILGEREIVMESKESHSSESGKAFCGSDNGRHQSMHSKSERNDSNVGVAVAVVAVAVIAVVAGIIIFG